MKRKSIYSFIRQTPVYYSYHTFGVGDKYRIKRNKILMKEKGDGDYSVVFLCTDWAEFIRKYLVNKGA